MDNKKKSNEGVFADFGDDFQERIIQALLIDTAWAEQMQEILKIEYFELEHLKFLVKTYYDYYNKYRSFPTIPILAGIIKETLEKGANIDEVLLLKIVPLLKKTKLQPDLRDLPYVKDRTLDFCKKQAMQEALYKSTELILKNEYENVVEVMKQALMAGEETSEGHDFEEDREARYSDIERDPIPLCIPHLDQKEVLNGGLGRGELGIFVGAPGVGKSHWLTAVGAAAVSKAYNVLHITLEMSEVEVGRRYDGWFTDINNREIGENKETVEKWYEDHGNELGRLFIKEYPASSATVNTFRAYLHKIAIKKNFRPDLIIVDYADEMCSIKKFDATSSRHEYKAIYRDLRNFAREMNVAVWSASQSNREGSSADIVTGENMSESFRKLDVPDFVFTGACKPQDKAKGILRGFIAKNRNGQDGIIFPIQLDKSTSRFKIISEEEFFELSRTKEDQENDLKSRLKAKLKKDKKEFEKSDHV